MRSACNINQELVKDVANKLSELHALMKAYNDERNRGEGQVANEFARKVEAAFKAKDRALEAWQRHHREHGC